MASIPVRNRSCLPSQNCHLFTVGLSILCWLALAVLLLVPNGHHFDRYIVWLVGGGLYFPIVFIFTRLKIPAF